MSKSQWPLGRSIQVGYRNWVGYVLSLLLLACIWLAIAWPSRQIPWSLIDDPTHVVEFPQHMLEGIQRGILSGPLHGQPGLIVTEFYRGRFRPVGWHYFMLSYIAFGANSQAHHLVRFGLLAIIALSLFLTALALIRSPLAGFLSALFFMLFAPGWEGFYRLSPGEIPLAALQSISIAALAWIFALRSRSRGASVVLSLLSGVSIVGLVLSSWTKESSVAMIPFLACLIFFTWLPFGYAATSQWRRRVASIATIGLAAELLLVAILIAGGAISGGGHYGEGGITIALRNLLWYSWILLRTYGILLIIALMSFGKNLLYAWCTRSRLSDLDYWQLLWLVWLIGGIVFQAPWRAIIERYLLPYILGLSLFLGIELSRVWAKLSTLGAPRRRLYAIILTIGMVLFLWENVTWGATIYEGLRSRDTSTYQFTRYLAQEAPPGAQVWVNTPQPGEIDSEFTSGIGRALRVFWHRDDIAVSSLGEADLNTCCAGDMVALWTHAAVIDPAEATADLANRSKLVWQNSYTVHRLWSPGAWLEHLLLTGPLNRPNRAPLDTYIYAWQILRVKP